MSRQESEDHNFLRLARSPVKRTPRSCVTAPAGERLSGATTARMSTEGSIRSVGSSASAASEAPRRLNVLRPLAGNSMDNSVFSSGSAARTSCSSASALDKMSSTISSKKKAVAARRFQLPVSRTLKLSPAVDTTRQHQQESGMAEARTDAAGGSTTPYSAADLTQQSITQSALFATLDRLPPTPQGDAPPSNQGKNSSLSSGSLDNNYRMQPSTPLAAVGEMDFLEGGEISNIDEGRSGAWSDCSFTNAAFSPDPATPRVEHDGSKGIDGGDRGASARREQASATAVSPILQEEGPRPPAAEIAVRATSSVSITSAYPSSACTPGAVSALLRMGGHSVGTAATPDSDAAEASRYRGYVTRSPLATSGASGEEECGEGGDGFDVPNTPDAAATLAAMMMGPNRSVGGPGTGAAEVMGEEEEEEEQKEVRSSAEGDAMKDDDEKPAAPFGLQQPKQPTPETPSRRDNMSARLPIITPRRRKAASQLLDLSKATPKKLIRAIIGGWNGPPAQAGTQRKQYARFVPQVAKLVEDAEEETPRTLVKGICENENPLDYAVKSARCNSTSAAEAAAAAAAAAAASSAAAAVAESAKAVGDRAEGGGADDDSVARPNPTAQRPAVASSPAAPAVVVHSSLSAKDVGNGFLKIVLCLILLVLLVCGALTVAVVVYLAFAGPPVAEPIY